MSEALEKAALKAFASLIGEAGVAEDAGIMAAQIERALRILDRPPIPRGALWEREPASHAATLAALAPKEDR